MSEANYKGFQKLQAHPLIGPLRDALDNREHFSISGLKSSVTPFILSLLLEDLKQPACIILQDEDELENTLAEFKVWTRQRDLYAYPFVHDSITNLEHAALMGQMKSVRAMLEPDAARGIWISTIEALSASCFSLDFIDQPTLSFEPGQEIQTDQLMQDLEKKGFHHEDKVDQRGDYALRGGILDIFPHFAQHPVRIELFGNEIDTIREFNTITQRSIRHLTRFVLDEVEYDSIKDIKRDGSISDYIPDDCIFFVQSPDITLHGLDPNNAFSQNLLANEGSTSSYQRIDFGPQIDQAKIHFAAELIEPSTSSLSEAISFLQERSKASETFLIEEYGSSLHLAKHGDIECWSLEGNIEYNFTIPELASEVYAEKHIVQIFEADTMSHHEAQIADFIELELGDYIVHENYGIGQFLGMVAMEKGGETNDFILLQFSGGSKVYVPIAQLPLVQKYIGKGDSTPELSKIGSKAWEMKKKKARKAIDSIVMELVHRQAFRENQSGFAYSEDSKDQRSFERAFPYNDTPCQNQAITRIKQEMQNPKPMDHLLCGDVGFGKTEVAMRAAHKSMLDSKQVAVLAPTTILAEQHYTNFCERFKDKKHLVGVLSRFQTKKESDEVMRKLESGDLLVVVGTHRLLSKNIEFADLGLMILDEEQRFGVKQKEQLKKKHPKIDVLSLSATPIPRTLHMSMLGIRSISNLTIAPENRHAIRTYIREMDKGIIKHAIGRELERGGQSYFLHNRIEDIYDIKDMLQELFPKARIAVGHGQMTENELTEVMHAFYALEVDIFISTTIIANGIDIPTANTMVINDAHRFGLSELHQIRGRIGRYSIQAYCYLLLPPMTKLPAKSMRRLRAIEEHQELGAGFKLAMRDMEIRGVGNILGNDQHGQIADIGYDLYTQYLSQAIAEMKGEKPQAFVETELTWPSGSTYFPKTYLSSHNDRIDFYRRISFARDHEQLDKIKSELKDRFGKAPKATLGLLDLFSCKISLHQMKFKSLKRRDGGESALMEPADWPDDLKLAWVLDNQNEMAFYNDQYIVMKVDKIWDRLTQQKIEKEPYQRYSYYNVDDRPEPLEVLKTIVEFSHMTLEAAKGKVKQSGQVKA